MAHESDELLPHPAVQNVRESEDFFCLFSIEATEEAE